MRPISLNTWSCKLLALAHATWSCLKIYQIWHSSRVRSSCTLLSRVQWDFGAECLHWFPFGRLWWSTTCPTHTRSLSMWWSQKLVWEDIITGVTECWSCRLPEQIWIWISGGITGWHTFTVILSFMHFYMLLEIASNTEPWDYAARSDMFSSQWVKHLCSNAVVLDASLKSVS
jgi:hypothetical protein